jgi:hypothetical protein
MIAFNRIEDLSFIIRKRGRLKQLGGKAWREWELDLYPYP